MLFKIYVVLPIICLVVAWFLGSKPWGWALLGLIIWYGGIFSLPLVVDPDPFLLFFAILMSFLGLWVATAFGLAFGRVKRPAPVDVTVDAASKAYDEYVELDAETKAKVDAFARAAAKFGCGFVGEALRKKGYQATGTAFRRFGRAL